MNRNRRAFCALLSGVALTTFMRPNLAFANGQATKTRAAAAVEAERTPPSCLKHFARTPVPLAPGDLDISIKFNLACLDCKGDAFQISAFPLVAPDPSRYSEIAPGQTMYRPPHTLKCLACRAEHPLFDIRTQGYDGVLNGGGDYESGTKGKAFIPGRYRVEALFLYNVELEELRGLAAGAKVTVSDLFDWISIIGTATHAAQNIELSYECA